MLQNAALTGRATPRGYPAPTHHATNARNVYVSGQRSVNYDDLRGGRGAMMVERIDEYLRDLADRQELIARASADMPRFWREVQEEEDEQWAFGVADLRSELGSQMLCFRSGAFNL